MAGATRHLTGWNVIRKPDRAYVQLRGWERQLRGLMWQKVYVMEGIWIPFDPRYPPPPHEGLVQEAMRRSQHEWKGKV